MNNCIRPPHFPPHCGCPAGIDMGEYLKRQMGRTAEEARAFLDANPDQPGVVMVPVLTMPDGTERELPSMTFMRA